MWLPAPVTGPMPEGYSPVLWELKTGVQDAQQAYSAIMAAAWREVVAGRLPEAAYWRLSSGDLLAETGELVSAAAQRYDADAALP